MTKMEEREAEERQRTEELDTIRHSLPRAQPQQPGSFSSQTQLPPLQEEEEDDNQSFHSQQPQPQIQYPVIKMGDSSSKNQLPNGMKLQGEENYVI